MLLKVQLPARQRPPAYNGTSIGWLCLYWSPDLRKCPVPEAVKACLESKLSVRDGERTRFTTYKLNKSQFLKKVINAATLTHTALISQWKCVSLGFPFLFSIFIFCWGKLTWHFFLHTCRGIYSVNAFPLYCISRACFTLIRMKTRGWKHSRCCTIAQWEHVHTDSAGDGL